VTSPTADLLFESASTHSVAGSGLLKKVGLIDEPDFIDFKVISAC